MKRVTSVTLLVFVSFIQLSLGFSIANANSVKNHSHQDLRRILQVDLSKLSKEDQSSLLDEMKEGLYRMRSELERIPDGEKKAFLMKEFAFYENIEVLENEVTRQYHNGDFSEEEYRLALRQINEFNRISAVASEIEDHEALSFLDQLIQQSDQALGPAMIVVLVVFVMPIAMSAVGLAIGAVLFLGYGIGWLVICLFETITRKNAFGTFGCKKMG